MTKGAGYFLIELMIVTLGVSLSLLLNDWREDRRNEEMEIQFLNIIQGNLEMDSVLTNQHHFAIDLFTNSARQMANINSEVPLDSFNIWLDHISSYSKLQTIDVGFQELSSSGIQLTNDSLSRRLLSYYSNQQHLVEEWNKIESEFVLNEIIPFIIREFPSLKADGGTVNKFVVKQHPKLEFLQQSHFQNLLVTSLMYQNNMKAISQYRADYRKGLLLDIREELKKLTEE